MKRLRKIFNMVSSLFLVLTFSGCAGLESGLVSCLEELKDRFPTPPPTQNTGEVPTSLELLFPQGNFSSTTQTQEYKDCFVLVNGALADASKYDIEWKIDGVTTQNTSEMYTFAPQSVEKSIAVEVVLTHTEITDKLDEFGEYIKEETTLSTNSKFVYYEPFDSLSAKREVNNGAYTFYFEDLSDDAIVQWFVNGVETCVEQTFNFAPIYGGNYEITAKVNGIDVVVEDNQITKVGQQQITNLQVDYDNYYPNVKISFNGDNNAQYKLECVQGSKTKEFTFNGNTTYIPFEDIASSSHIQSEIKVKTINNGIYADQDYIATQSVYFPTSGLDYLADSYGFENKYITSEQDFYEQFDYMLLNRDQPTEEDEYTTKTCEFYFEYNETNISDLVNDAFDACGYTGSYKLNSLRNASVYTITVQFYTGNICELPSSQNTPSSNDYANNLNAYPLAISSVGRENSSLPIDQREQIPVSNTEQLYRMAELGYCPVPVQDSATEEVWENAREILSVITDEEMSDYENTLAIYDWIMYKNKYNNSVTNLTTAQATSSPAFYLEGLLYSNNYGYSVCDGISKTYSLLCNMLGIDCIRVVGQAGVDESWGGHAWNKVKVDGQWYIVDATWGDLTMGFTYKTGGIIGGSTNTDYYELGLHNYFLVTDSFVKDNHEEEVENYYPKTATLPYNHYQRQTFSYNGNKVNAYLNESGANLKNKLDIIARSIVEEVNSKNRIQEFSISTKTISSYYFLYELSYSSLSKNEIVSYMSKTSSFTSILSSASLGYSLTEVDGTISIIVSYNYKNKLANSSLVID